MQNNKLTNVFLIHNDIEIENYKKAISLLNDDCLDKAWKYIEKINLANLTKKICVNKLENEIYFAKYRSYVDWKGDIITVEESEGTPPPDPGPDPDCCESCIICTLLVLLCGACCGVPIYDCSQGTDITLTACKQISKWSYSCPCCCDPCEDRCCWCC